MKNHTIKGRWSLWQERVIGRFFWIVYLAYSGLGLSQDPLQRSFEQERPRSGRDLAAIWQRLQGQLASSVKHAKFGQLKS